MSTVAEKTYTPEDLLAMPDAKDYELVDGHLEERHMSRLSSWVAGQVFFALNAFLRDDPLGWAWPADQGYECFPDSPGKVRKPDVSYVSKDRLPGGLTSEGYIYVPPNLAVEVLSPNDSAYKVDNKVEEYLKVGVSLVWVINPEARSVHVYRRDGSVSRLHEGDELSGEDVLPRFRCRLALIFPTHSPDSGSSSQKANGEPNRTSSE
jgi:Uma2 family endonuclease